MSMQKVAGFSKHPSRDGKMLTGYRLSYFKPANKEDLILLQLAEGIIDRKEFSEREGWLYESYDSGEKTGSAIYVRELAKGNAAIRRFYCLGSGRYAAEITSPKIYITARDIMLRGKEKVEAELKEIFAK